MSGPDTSPGVVTRTVKTTRFQYLTIKEDLVLSFPDGLVGFPGPREFALVPHSPESPFLWLQDLKDGTLAFPVTALDLPDSAGPTLLTAEERKQLGLAPRGKSPPLGRGFCVERTNPHEPIGAHRGQY